MQIELNAEQQRILERATRDGTSMEDVLNQAFAMIDAKAAAADWQPDDLEALRAHIEEGWEESERGELYDPEEAIRMLREGREERNVA